MFGIWIFVLCWYVFDHIRIYIFFFCYWKVFVYLIKIQRISNEFRAYFFDDSVRSYLQET